MVEKDYIDITPKGVDKDAKGQAGKESTVFQETEWEQINNNPKGLTKEGVEKSIELWKRSVNKHVVIKYKSMLHSCKNLQASGKNKEGATIFARDKKGNPTWVDQVPDTPKNKKGD